MSWYFRQILIKENEMQNAWLWCPKKLKKMKKLQEIANKIKFFYVERVVDKSCDKITEDFWQKLLWWNTRNDISEPLDLKISWREGRGGHGPRLPG